MPGRRQLGRPRTVSGAGSGKPSSGWNNCARNAIRRTPRPVSPRHGWKRRAAQSMPPGSGRNSSANANLHPTPSLPRMRAANNTTGNDRSKPHDSIDRAGYRCIGRPGEEFARLLAKDHHNLILVARKRTTVATTGRRTAAALRSNRARIRLRPAFPAQHRSCTTQYAMPI